MDINDFKIKLVLEDGEFHIDSVEHEEYPCYISNICKPWDHPDEPTIYELWKNFVFNIFNEEHPRFNHEGLWGEVGEEGADYFYIQLIGNSVVPLGKNTDGILKAISEDKNSVYVIRVEDDLL